MINSFQLSSFVFNPNLRRYSVASDNVMVTRSGSLNSTVVRSRYLDDRGYPEGVITGGVYGRGYSEAWSGFKLQQPFDGHAARVRAILRTFMRGEEHVLGEAVLVEPMTSELKALENII